MGEIPEAVRVKKKGEQYVKFPAELIRSPALRNLPQRALRVVLAVLDEHNRHAGKENGNLTVPYKTLKEWLRTSDKTAIALAIKQAKALKLIRAIRARLNKDGRGEATRYGVTWLAGHDGEPPPDDWREILTDDQATKILDGLKKRRRSDRYKAAERASQLGAQLSNGLSVSNADGAAQ